MQLVVVLFCPLLYFAHYSEKSDQNSTWNLWCACASEVYCSVVCFLGDLQNNTSFSSYAAYMECVFRRVRSKTSSPSVNCYSAYTAERYSYVLVARVRRELQGSAIRLKLLASIVL